MTLALLQKKYVKGNDQPSAQLWQQTMDWHCGIIGELPLSSMWG